jgi:hydrogenase-4 component B
MGPAVALRLVLIALVVAAVSGVPGLLLGKRSSRGQWIAAFLMGGASLLGLAGAFSGLRDDASAASFFPWPAMGDSLVGLDPLSAFFLVPIFLVGGLGSIYGLGYWPQRRHPGNGRRLGLFWGLLIAGMTLLVLSRHGMAFLLGWEVMALSAFFLVTTEEHRDESRRAGWWYLIAAHVGTLTLFGLFAFWRWVTGSYALVPVARESIDLWMMNGLFTTALFGFGLKAGLMPLHFWLPGAHASAPSHVSAILSGVVLKMGIYGLVRFLSLLPDPPAAWGGVILALGAVSGLLGVVFALGQHDLKRLLAYHSVENIGIILMGLGLAMLGRSHGRPEWVVLGLAGCLLHVWNHALFKSLLFLGAGAVVHAAHTRRIDLLGGLGQRMPWTSALFLLGAVAICGLPPLNGFVSELFLYMGLLQTAAPGEMKGAAVLVVAPVLAVIGALALACFVKVYGAVFLGTARTNHGAHAGEAPLTMRLPMLSLAACCALIGLAPALFVPGLDAVIASWAPGSAPLAGLGTLVPLGAITLMSLLLVAGAVVVTIGVRLAGRPGRSAVTWDCGYARPTARMQYTASSFAQSIVALFGWVLRPSLRAPHVRGLFPPETSLHSHVDDVVLDRWLVPAGHGIERRFGWFRRFQQGLTQHYILYILITVILMLSAGLPFGKFFARWFSW